jgi:quinol monooxygenase YgiN
MIVSTAKVVGKPENRTEFLQTIRPLLQPIQSAKGCLLFGIYVDAVDENTFLLLGEWESDSDLENCRHSDDFAVLRGAINVLGAQSSEFKARVVSNGSNGNMSKR